MSKAPGPAPTPWHLSNQFLGLVLLGALIALFVSIYTSDWASEIQMDRFQLGFFPLVGVVWMMIAALMLVVDHARKKEFGEIGEIRPGSWPWIIGLSVAWYAYAQLVLYLGFILTTFLFISILLRIGGVQSWKTIAGAGALCVVVVFLLFFAIGVDLPTGRVWS